MPPVHVMLLVVLCWTWSGTRAQTSVEDLKRPYSFGFTIENMQHRQEMKDANGIITGEYGFVTADGWYTTTYYATDAEGKFKILGRKRERVGPPVNPYATTPRPAITSPPTTTTTTTTTTVAPRPTARPAAFPGIPGCGSCIIPTTSRSPSSPSGFRPSPAAGSNGFRPTQGGYPSTGRPPLYPSSTARPQYTASSFSSSSTSSNSNSNSNSMSVSNQQNSFSSMSSFGQNGGQQGGVGGTPPVVVVGDGGPLYRFNYTAGHHGHHETGAKDGSKRGGYFVNGRDGVAHRVTYEADARGFVPKISQVRLSPQDTPREDTEKLAGLKGYEFVWFNRRRR